ncbi:hypothetical protein FB451DRAFT_1206136, partial [Mycena latifolia]
MAPRIPQLPMMAPPAPLQFFMPPPIQGQNPLNPDLAGPINWRVFLPPSTARMPRSRTGPLLQAPATSPPCFCVAITFEDPSLMHWVQRWGPIRVPVHSRTVTVGDVPGRDIRVCQPAADAGRSRVRRAAGQSQDGREWTAAADARVSVCSAGALAVGRVQQFSDVWWFEFHQHVWAGRISISPTFLGLV